MADCMAEKPLLPCFVPQRSTACSRLSAATTPSRTGTPVAMDTSLNALDVAWLMRSALHDRAEAHDRVVFLCGELRRDERQLVRARHPHERQILPVAAHAQERVLRALHKLLRQKTVEATDDDGDPKSLRRKLSVDFFHSFLHLF